MSRLGSELTILASAGSTADRTSAVFANAGYRHGQFVVDITARSSTDAGPVVTVQGIVPNTTGTFYTILSSTAIGTSSTSDAVTAVLHVGPSFTTAANARAAASLPTRFRVTTTYASTADITYSVGAHLS